MKAEILRLRKAAEQGGIANVASDANNHVNHNSNNNNNNNNDNNQVANDKSHDSTSLARRGRYPTKTGKRFHFVFSADCRYPPKVKSYYLKKTKHKTKNNLFFFFKPN